MTYSDETMSKMDRAIRVGVVKSSELGDDWTAESHLPNIGDTCCGNCGAGLCYVDGVTGA